MGGRMAGDTEDVVDLFQFIEGMYEGPDRKPGKDPEPGQIVIAPVPEQRHRPWIADVTRSDPTSHDRADLVIRPQSENDFRGKAARLPVHQLHLTESHELMVARAKMRRCIVLARTSGVDAMTLPEGGQRNKALNAFHPLYYLAPLYSVSNKIKTTAFGSVMSIRIRCLMYPEFFFFPRSGGIINTDSVARLDHMFVNQLAFGVEPQNLFLRDEAMGMLMDQVRVLLGEEASDDYVQLREVLLDGLPAIFK